MFFCLSFIPCAFFLPLRVYRRAVLVVASISNVCRFADVSHGLLAFWTRIYSQFTASRTPVLLVSVSETDHSPLEGRYPHNVQTRHTLVLCSAVVPAVGSFFALLFGPTRPAPCLERLAYLGDR